MLLLQLVILKAVEFGSLGALIGLFCGDRAGWVLATAPLASLALYVAEMFYTGLLSTHWSAVDYLLAAVYQIVPYLLLSLLPCVVSATFVGRWRTRRFRHDSRTI